MSCIRFPKQITAGVTFNFKVNLTAYPASSGWSLVAYLRGESAIDISSQADGNQHIFNITAETTKAYTAGHYGYSLRAIHESGAVDELESGVVEIKADLASISGATDLRSHAQKTLAALEAVIEGRASLDQERYRINNRELYRTPMETLIKLRNHYRAEVSRERAKASGKSLFGQVVRVKLR
ncbi:MAG: hypothetical protein E7D55_02475 [Acinetobacter junii]|uniref:Uncharacterized protein n=1 Tax=Acinetobacter venetianus TaxID=52133 RepID=A0A150HMA3_9GAMM|nr:hypothetical protein [Acinetobacter venetianus]KXZ66785.1 hypothetical protein AVENLUH5627_02479 [Acinetobacter venetianus]MDU2407110.1 hypothetical protein [Acinetobacter junii]